jgi:hypothetical protein
MKKVKISHETPFCLLEKSLNFCDYQYALPHLLESNEEYRNHFIKCKERGIEIYLDNSLHELSYAMDADVLLKWIDILRPSNFFVPDVWEDKTSSVRNAKLWSQVELPDGVMKVAVVQAKSTHEAILCTQAYKDFGYKKIAYSYGASYYNEVCPHPNKDLGKAIGRFMVISQLYKENILTKFDRVHLLGTASPIEFGMYKNIECIESIDTSNPIMAAIENTRYNEMGLLSKPIANMNNFQDKTIEQIASNPTLFYSTVEHNVKMFREINGL